MAKCATCDEEYNDLLIGDRCGCLVRAAVRVCTECDTERSLFVVRCPVCGAESYNVVKAEYCQGIIVPDKNVPVFY